MQNKKLRNLKEAAEYCGLSETAFKNIFYKINHKQNPEPTYLGESIKVIKNLYGSEREIEVNTILRFTDKSLDKFIYGGKA